MRGGIAMRWLWIGLGVWIVVSFVAAPVMARFCAWEEDDGE